MENLERAETAQPPLPVLQSNALRIKHMIFFRLGIMIILVAGCRVWLVWSMIHDAMFSALVRLLFIAVLSLAICVLLVGAVIVIRVAFGLHEPTVIDSKISD